MLNRMRAFQKCFWKVKEKWCLCDVFTMFLLNCVRFSWGFGDCVWYICEVSVFVLFPYWLGVRFLWGLCEVFVRFLCLYVIYLWGFRAAFVIPMLFTFKTGFETSFETMFWKADFGPIFFFCKKHLTVIVYSENSVAFCLGFIWPAATKERPSKIT